MHYRELDTNPLLHNSTQPHTVVLPMSSGARFTTSNAAGQATSSVRGRPPGSKNKIPEPIVSDSDTTGGTIGERVCSR